MASPSPCFPFNMVAMAFILLMVQLGMPEKTIYDVANVETLLPSTTCFSSSFSHKDMNGSKHSTSLNVMNLHGPCHPSSGEKLNHKEILYHDQSRVAALQHRHRLPVASAMAKRKRKPVGASLIPARTGTTLGTGNYIVTVGFGTPKKDLSLVFDTGSDVTWIQCQPCVSYCYQQQEPIFDPSQSSTYSNISCTSPYCSELDPSSCSSSTCLYAVQYGDNSYTVGFYGSDTLSLSSTDVIPGFRFGCGEKNRGLFGKSAGLLGLGRRTSSLVSQSNYKYGGSFSYCLPATSSSTGYLNLGRKDYNGVKYTSMLRDPTMPSFYFLDLVSILVGGKQLPISPSVFSNAGTLIDSGTVISRLPPAAYSALKAEFSELMLRYPKAQALSILDTCYDFSGLDSITVPTVAWQFRGGVTVNINLSGILYVASVSQACLAFAANDNASDLAIIGNVQQRKLNVVYDVSKSLVGFGPGNC